MRYTLLFFSLFLFSFKGISQVVNPLLAEDAYEQEKWVDSIYNAMSLKEKIGQLFMVQVFSNKKSYKDKQHILKQIKQNNIGGIIYSKGDPVSQAKLNNELQAVSKLPLLIGMDAEWGLSMRLKNTFSFPWNMTLGAIQDDKLIEQTGKQLGEHCKRLGVHFNFAPVVDINTNPKNPIIGNRSFGEDKYNVTNKAMAFMKGMQSVGVLANAKHFPGHGDTDTDSHKTLPTVNFDEYRIDDVELYPYKKLINEGLSSVMVAHLNIPSLEPREGFPSSISENIVTNILKLNLGFKGLIFTDALDMKGASNFSAPGDIDLQAFLAGNDVLLISEDVSKGIAKITEAYGKGKITEERLAHSVKKILMAKYKVGLHSYTPISTTNLVEDLNRVEDEILYEQLLENAITVVKNKNDLLPIKHIETKTMAYVKLGDAPGKAFYEELKKYGKVDKVEANTIKELLSKLKAYNTVIVGFHRSNESPWKSHEISGKYQEWIRQISKKHRVILDLFVKPYALLNIEKTNAIESIIVSYQNSVIAQQKSAQLIFGAIPAKGVLPVSAGDEFQVGDGIHYNSLFRLGYTIPERVGIDSYKLKKIDSIAKYAINAQMTPGIQMVIARKGKVFYNKSFGKHTYDGNKKVTFDDVYDVASVTKIIATLPLIMELVDKRIISLDSKLKELLPSYKATNKADITIKKMLSHYAQLRPWIPFYFATIDSVTQQPLEQYYKKKKDRKFNLTVAKDLYIRKDYPDSIKKLIIESDLLNDLRYRYSDLPYYILKEYVEDYYGMPLDELTQSHIYEPLGANYTTYNPTHKFPESKIIPTEIDDYFRHQKIQGYVHDMGAAMLNGVGGHAGIFSNANDVAKIMQMYLQQGYYGGKRYFRAKTFDQFNTCYYCKEDNRRGVGFDKPQQEGEGATCGCLSMKSFGHSGFTGTYAWADPEEQIVYVFLSNRTYPTHKARNKLARTGIRTNIQQAIYEAIIN